MKRLLLATLATLMLSGCILTKEDLDCWYEDMCKDFAGAADSHADQQPAPSAHAP